MAFYELRDLKAKDIPLACDVIKEIGADELIKMLQRKDIAEMMKSSNIKNRDGQAFTQKEINTVGMSFVVGVCELIIRKCSDCWNPLVRFLSNISDKTVEEIEEFPMEVFAEMVSDTVRKKEFPDFFTHLLKFIKPMK